MTEPGSRNPLTAAGLLVLVTFSPARGWGRKPPGVDEFRTATRHISTGEAMDILRKFPDLIPSYLSARKNDSEYMAGTFGFVEIRSPVLERTFPAARFYMGHDFWLPPSPYLMAIVGNKRHGMPEGFNRLVFDHGMKVTNNNVIELAKALLLVAVWSEPVRDRVHGDPHGRDSTTRLTFLDAEKVENRLSEISYDARLNVTVDGETELWYVKRWHEGFGEVRRVADAGRLIRGYYLLDARPD